MNKREFYVRIRSLFGPGLQTRGFTGGNDYLFTRNNVAGVEQQIVFRGRFEYRTERYRFDVAAANRFLVLEHLLGVSEEDGIVPCVASPIHLLRHDKDLYEWYVDDPNTVDVALDEIDDYAIPFLDKYADVREVKNRLMAPANWFTLDPQGRSCLLAAILFFEGDKAEALRMVENELAKLKNEVPAKWSSLELLRRRFVALK